MTFYVLLSIAIFVVGFVVGCITALMAIFGESKPMTKEKWRRS